MTGMDTRTLVERFYVLIAPDLPNEWDVEEAVESLVGDPMLEPILAQVPVIWPVSNSLCYNYLGLVQKALTCIRQSDLPAWVNEILDHYEAGGLRAAQQFMLDVEENFVCRMHGRGGVRLAEVEGWLLPYVQGLAGGHLDLATAETVSTDTEIIYLPAELTHFDREEENATLYKLLASYQWCFIALNTFFPEFSQQEFGDRQQEELERFLNSFSSPELASRLYHTLENLRAGFFLQKELPGLMRSTRLMRKALIPKTADGDDEKSVLSVLDQQCCLLEARPTAAMEPWYAEILSRLTAEDTGPETSVALCRALYERVFEESKKDYVETPVLFQGELRLQAVYAARQRQRQLIEEDFIEGLSTYLLALPEAKGLIEEQQENGAGGGESAGDKAMLLDRRPGDGEDAEETIYLTIANESFELPEELEKTVRRMADLGMTPSRYVTSAMGRAGQSMAEGEFASATESQPACVAPVTYDEWDYRRNGYRKNWCILTEREMEPVRSTFVSATLARYRGQIIRLRHQFEMMRNQERFLRRQRDGDDIDFDALVESIADTQAGLPPSDRLFIRLQRDERDIAAFFLVDMSNSTEGWVGTAIKESLVLICEAMEVLGDRYGIYGFSGMRRLRCETFHVKHLDEPYSNEVRQRIAAIAPREYTRMAPAIRHMTTLFQGVDARIRLLITLSDGKPEDYDDYKGDYAIEDTRQALLEARSAGLHPFCITIDRHAHDYMAHMYGERNYIFINDVRKLPARMPEIYRALTA